MKVTPGFLQRVRTRWRGQPRAMHVAAFGAVKGLPAGANGLGSREWCAMPYFFSGLRAK
jgi:hypothetical protein